MAKKKYYLLHAVWFDCQTRKYSHRVFAKQAESKEEVFQAFADDHHEWSTTPDYTTVGEIAGSPVSVSVHEIVGGDGRGQWKTWIARKRASRREQLLAEQRQADMETLKQLVKKYGISALEMLALAAGDANNE